MPRWAAGVWAVSVIALLFAEAIVRLSLRSIEHLGERFSVHVGMLLALSLFLFGYGEGYRALHRRFVPGVLTRIARLPPPSQLGTGRLLLAPFYALGLVYGERSTLAKGWLAVALIVLAIAVVRLLPEPWRSLIDAGVALALAIGLGSLVVGFIAALRSQQRSA